jgi:hypothetical protein
MIKLYRSGESPAVSLFPAAQTLDSAGKEKPMNLYENLAEQVKVDIRHGLFAPGERLPSVRRLSEQRRVSPASVVAAYRLLEAQGWLEARPQSGFYARHPEALPPAAGRSDGQDSPCAVNVTELALRLSLNAQRKDLVSLGAAVPHPGLLPLKDLRAALGRALRDHDDVGSRYSLPPGEEVLRLAIARRAAEWGGRIGPDDVVVTDGCQEGLNLALRAVTRAGDIVAIESPAFFGTLAGHRIAWHAGVGDSQRPGDRHQSGRADAGAGPLADQGRGGGQQFQQSHRQPDARRAQIQTGEDAEPHAPFPSSRTTSTVIWRMHVNGRARPRPGTTTATCCCAPRFPRPLHPVTGLAGSCPGAGAKRWNT